MEATNPAEIADHPASKGRHESTSIKPAAIIRSQIASSMPRDLDFSPAGIVMRVGTKSALAKRSGHDLGVERSDILVCDQSALAWGQDFANEFARVLENLVANDNFVGVFGKRNGDAVGHLITSEAQLLIITENRHRGLA